jgi:hypothetical protein
LNVENGNGSSAAGGAPLPPGVTNTFGIGLVGTSQNNLVEENPPIQIAATFGATVGADIQEVSTQGGNTFAENLCLTYAGSTVPAPCPSIPKSDDVEARNDGGVPPNTAIPRAQRADVGLDISGHPRVEAVLAGTIGVLILGLVVPKRRSRNLSRKD